MNAELETKIYRVLLTNLNRRIHADVKQMTLTEIVSELPQPSDKEALKRKLLEDIASAGGWKFEEWYSASLSEWFHIRGKRQIKKRFVDYEQNTLKDAIEELLKEGRLKRVKVYYGLRVEWDNRSYAALPLPHISEEKANQGESAEARSSRFIREKRQRDAVDALRQHAGK